MTVEEREAVLWGLAEALGRLVDEPLGALVPEVRSNLAYALPGASRREEVAAFPGRLTELDGRLVAVSGPRFGASRHLAAVVLAAMRRHPDLRAAMAIRCDTDTLAACTVAGLRLARFDRAEEPPEVKAREGSTLEWATGRALDEAAAAGRPPPDAIWDEGEVGKEPVVRVLGRTPAEVAERVLRVAAALGSP